MDKPGLLKVTSKINLQEIANELLKKIEQHNGLSIYARSGKLFEQWVQVEICNILDYKLKKDVEVKYHITEDKKQEIYVDLKIENLFLELKIISNKQNDLSIIDKDIDQLKRIKRRCGINNSYGILFVIYPVEINIQYNQIKHDRNDSWTNKYDDIKKEVSNLMYLPFKFKNCDIKGAIGYGLIDS